MAGLGNHWVLTNLGMVFLDALESELMLFVLTLLETNLPVEIFSSP
jgi:hypothetical protein